MVVYVSVDVEASGCIPSEYSLLSIGACVVNNPKNTFYAELRPLNGNYTESAMKIVGDLWIRCNIDGLNPEFVMKKFEKWLKSLNGRPIMVSFGEFDWMFIDYYFQKYLGYSPFGINGVLDIKAYFCGMVNCSWEETTKKRIKYRYPIFKTQRVHTHNALQDAQEQSELFLKMKEFNDKLKREIIND